MAAVVRRPVGRGAVLAEHPDAESRLRRSIAATIENPVASAMLQRASDLANGNNLALRIHAELGCRYRQRRTETFLERPPRPNSGRLRQAGPRAYRRSANERPARPRPSSSRSGSR